MGKTSGIQSGKKRNQIIFLEYIFISHLKQIQKSLDKYFNQQKNIYPEYSEIPKKILKDSSRHECPNKIFEDLEKDFRAIQINQFSLQANENNCQNNMESTTETLKMAKHILKDIHILKSNILRCDKTTPLKQNLVPRFARAGNKEDRQDKQISSRKHQDNIVGVKRKRE